MGDIVGHQKIRVFLDRCLEKDRVSHAYLFWGPENVGKFSLALEFSKKLTKGGSSGTNPNLIVTEPKYLEAKGVIKKQDIGVEEVRDIRKRLGLSSDPGKYNVAIINDADRLTKSAQNSLLKILEEPPKNSVIILVTPDRNKLLSTVLSRCQMIKFNNLSDSEIERVLPSKIENKERLMFWSMGRPGLAKKMVEDPNELKLREESSQDLDLAIRADVWEKFYLAEALSKNVPLTLSKLDFWITLLRKKMLEDKDPERIIRLKLIEKISASKEIIKTTNANVRLVLENLFLSF